MKWVRCAKDDCGWWRPNNVQPEPDWLIADKRIHKMDNPKHEGFIEGEE